MVNVNSLLGVETTKGGVVASRQLAARNAGHIADGKPPAVSFLRWATFWPPVCVYPAAQARDQGLDHDPKARGRTENPTHPVLRVLPSVCLLVDSHPTQTTKRVCVCVLAGALLPRSQTQAPCEFAAIPKETREMAGVKKACPVLSSLNKGGLYFLS